MSGYLPTRLEQLATENAQLKKALMRLTVVATSADHDLAMWGTSLSPEVEQELTAAIEYATTIMSGG